MTAARTTGWARRRGAARWAAALLALAAGLGPARAPAERPPPIIPVATERTPEIREIDPARDAAVVRRIEALRARLPEKYRHRNNFACAEARIAGLDKTEYFAHSGIQRLGKISGAAARKIAGISLRPNARKRRFQILCVNHNDEIEGPDCWPRHVDTEFKILEDLARHLPDPAAAGRVRLYTDLYPCASCRHVMAQFLDVYTNVQMQVLYRER